MPSAESEKAVIASARPRPFTHQASEVPRNFSIGRPPLQRREAGEEAGDVGRL